MLRPLLLLGLLSVLFACAGEDASPGSEPGRLQATVLQAEVPAEFAAGEAAFNTHCSTCHGSRGLGTLQGPPLVHIIYEPSHHGDVAFVLAAERGVRAHHWQFGDMPAQPDVTREQIEQITAYIRYLQRLVGIR